LGITHPNRVIGRIYMTNGWTNRETWLVNVHFGDYWENAGDVNGTKEYLETAWENAEVEGKRFFDDYISLKLVNWDELLEAYNFHEEAP